MTSNKQESLWCPLCDCPSDECKQIETDWESFSHAAQWITLAERARDEALSNLEQTEITPLPQRNR